MTGAAASAHPPPHLHSHHGHGEWHDYKHLHPRYRTSVEALRSFAKARQMWEHRGPSEHLDLEVTWDTPFSSLQGRDPARTVTYLSKWLLADVELKPLMYKLREIDEKRAWLEVMVLVHLAPHRPWWLPATWLLPRQVELQGIMHLRVSKGPEHDGSRDVVTCMDSELLNLGKLPLPIRLLSGLALGYVPAATEPLWSPLVGLLGDTSYRSRAEEGEGVSLLAKAKAAATAAAERAQEAVAAATGGVIGGAAEVPSKVAEQAQAAIGAAAATTAAAAERAAGGAAAAADKTAAAADAAAVQAGNGGLKGKVVEAVRDVVHDAASAVKGGVAAVAEKVAESPGRAKKGGAGGRA